jgi:alpha/beta superfamily hydrolase
MPEPLPQPHLVRTDDGHTLEGELRVATAERAGMVLCHPHPQYGGTMRSLVISALFGALPAVGVTCLRFNFRGVEGSEGTYDEGRGERHDVRAAIRALDAHLGPATPLVLTGWSFGADVALSSPDPRLAGWLAIAPPLRFLADEAAVGADERPKLVVLAQHDEFRPPGEVEAVAAAWQATEVQVVAGASHFFVGHTEAVVEAARGFADRFVGPNR